jgi:proteasome assembly chaperone (PAC2) family protein
MAISNAYYPDNQSASEAVSKLSQQIGVDMASNVLKEFAPELRRMFSRKHRTQDTGNP